MAMSDVILDLARLREERQQLKDRCVALTEFCASDALFDLDRVDRELLLGQRKHMLDYLTVLDRRIRRFDNMQED